MPKLTIDNRSVEVPHGTSVLEAAKQLGIVIPHFCYHEALGAVGSCRLCAMSFEEGPVLGVQMACMVPVQDGMVVSTTDRTVVELRAHVVEWLMMNHPHDCPVCDAGGECQLQDMTLAGGHSRRRYRGRKRTYRNQDLGPFIAHEMNRCIQCYRCVRTYQDYCGGDDFGVLGSRQRVYFGRFRDGPLESPFSGNLVDVCPTGVLTDKTFRFKSRFWDLQEAPSICPHCSLGCATIPGARHRELQRIRAGVNRRTNGFFICDRGRFGYDHVNHPERPRAPRLFGEQTSWPQALQVLKAALAEILAVQGPGAVAFLGSPRASLEANFQLLRWARSLGGERIVFNPHGPRDRAARILTQVGSEQQRSLGDLRSSDLIVLVGVDPLAEAPVLALAVRQAVRSGARALLLDPRPVKLPFRAAHLPLPPDRLRAALRALGAEDWSAFSRQQGVFLEGARKALDRARRPVLVGGGDLLGAPGLDELAHLAQTLSSAERPCGFMGIAVGPNSYGAALLAAAGPDFDDLLQAAAAGEVKALVCLEADPLSQSADPAQAAEALKGLELLAVLDYLPTPTARVADIFLPTTAPAESAGCFVNNEGRMQAFDPVLAPGIPLRETGAGDHPPRVFSAETPGALPRHAWDVLGELLGEQISLSAVRSAMEADEPRLSGLAALASDGEGVRAAAPAAPTEARSGAGVGEKEAAPQGEFNLLVCEDLFGSEEIGGYSAPLDGVRPAPCVQLHVEDAARLNILAGQKVRLLAADQELVLPAVLSAQGAPGTVVVPRVRGGVTATLVPGGGARFCRIEAEARHD
ncbi:NADH-quinone oxidoreductase subunit NuoG [Geoalkalibacter halelectricus]|uniref:NADH-quinone oxidoreductase subunit NuoG n=1 Tax=Geoalkalibacter halelectricus TaxID=2847045 RepID=A0ABY5ZPY1_9BACT|nr:NADH-quinone oxidoreductase subunit NuoG [Geoalkalibacter halelectricus]MDO3378688.1 NADH-quinone oxidoreductase subunit NuoG [Geoalkalibacter halelectricus]UWZ80002.1 NADH-quinone oxidoreductase subunit NuoG [Geoalkalibacter halelectricus]